MQDRLPSVDEIATALRPIVKAGLPVDPEFADETLLQLPAVLRRSSDPADRLSRVKALDELLNEHLDKDRDGGLGEVARILLAVATGFRGEPIGKRRDAVARLLCVTAEHVRTGIQPKVIKAIAWELHRASQQSAIESASPTSSDALTAVAAGILEKALFPDAQRVAKQLCWYAQEATTYVIAFDIAARAIGDLRSRHECWQEPRYITSRSTSSERGLWAFAHCCTHMRSLERDDVGREFLAEHFSVSPWPLWLDGRLGRDSIIELQRALLQAVPDEPRVFTEALLTTDRGAFVEREWLELISASADELTPESPLLPGGVGGGRLRLLEGLNEVVAVLNPLFPGQVARLEKELSYWGIAWNLVSYEMPEGGPNIGPYYEEMLRGALSAAFERMEALLDARKAFNPLGLPREGA